MVDFKKLGDKARDLIDKRGGTDSLKEDAAELKDIASGKGSIADKARAAAAAIKDPGDGDQAETGPAERTAKPEPDEPADEGGVADARAERRERRAARRKQRAADGGSGSEPA